MVFVQDDTIANLAKDVGDGQVRQEQKESETKAFFFFFLPRAEEKKITTDLIWILKK